MRTLGEMYDEWLDCVYEEEYDAAPDWMQKWRMPSEALQECDPVMYRCGYADWAQPDQFKHMECEDCGEQYSEDDIHRLVNECGDDDYAVCLVCAGQAFVCEECGEVCDKMDNARDDVCDTCREEMEEDE